MRNCYLAVGLALSASTAFACSPLPFDPIEHAADADMLIVGYVAGERYPIYEERVLAGGDPKMVEVWGERLLRILVVDSLRGGAGKVVEAPAPCGGPSPAAFERVVVSKGADGYTRVFDAEPHEKQARAAVRDGL